MLPNEFPTVFHQLGFVSKENNCVLMSSYPRGKEIPTTQKEGEDKEEDGERMCSREETRRLVSTSAIKESKRKGLTVRKKQKHCKTAKEEVEKQTENKQKQNQNLWKCH